MKLACTTRRNSGCFSCVRTANLHPESMEYVFAVIAFLLMNVGLVWAGSLIASCGNWSNARLCRVAENVALCLRPVS